MIEFETGFCGELKEVFVKDNIAFVVELDGQEIPFYNYVNDEGSKCWISNISPSGIDDLVMGIYKTSEILDILNEKLVDDGEDRHIGRIGGYYTSTFKVGYVKNMCMNCKHTYAFGTDWDIRCSKVKDNYGSDKFIGKHCRDCCEHYEF